MGDLASKFNRNKVMDECTSNSSLSALRYVTATVHTKSRWKGMFCGKKRLPEPIPPFRPPPAPIKGFKTSVTPGGVTMVYRQKKKKPLHSFKGRVEMGRKYPSYNPNVVRVVPKGATQPVVWRPAKDSIVKYRSPTAVRFKPR